MDLYGEIAGRIGIEGGGGGSSEVTITPVLTEGTKIADYEIDGTLGELYAPDPEALPGTIVTKVQREYNNTTQTKIATVTTLDTSNNQETSQDIYAPSPVQCWYTPGLEQDYQIGQFTYGGVTQNVYIPYFQRPLTAGANITIDDNNVISASNSRIDYSFQEQNTGQKWIDGKNIYQLTISIPTYPSNDFTISLADYNIDQVVDLISTAKSYYTYDGGIHWDDRRFVGNYSTQGSGYNLIYRIEGDHETPLNLRCIAQNFSITRLSSYHTIYYTKTI